MATTPDALADLIRDSAAAAVPRFAAVCSRLPRNLVGVFGTARLRGTPHTAMFKLVFPTYAEHALVQRDDGLWCTAGNFHFVLPQESTCKQDFSCADFDIEHIEEAPHIDAAHVYMHAFGLLGVPQVRAGIGATRDEAQSEFARLLRQVLAYMIGT